MKDGEPQYKEEFRAVAWLDKHFREVPEELVGYRASPIVRGETLISVREALIEAFVAGHQRATPIDREQTEGEG